jgi:hypothetical protein
MQHSEVGSVLHVMTATLMTAHQKVWYWQCMLLMLQHVLVSAQLTYTLFLLLLVMTCVCLVDYIYQNATCALAVIDFFIIAYNTRYVIQGTSKDWAFALIVVMTALFTFEVS